MPIPLDYYEWPDPPGPHTKWIIQTVDPSVNDLKKDDEVYFASDIPGKIKISNIVCTHGGTDSGASWKGIILTGAGTLATGARAVNPPVAIRIVSSHDDKGDHLECRSGTGSTGTGCWTADGG